ncbi:MAG TPA: FtsW/RodA/SpoVE family cell cycle protein [Anaerolineales bacterium]|nr:FtsW/RodA/SpoVE family cell cycle protein [Anaerolineales bacterium]
MNRIIQSRLLFIATVFLLLQAIIITLSAAVRARTWTVDFPFSHWMALAVWALVVARADHDISRKMPDADPYLLPSAALLSGWGILTIWRLDPTFGARQALWLGVSVGLFALGTRLSTLDFLRRYKYSLLTGGLLLLAITLVFGTNPSGSGPRLWLGYDELYLQPSEPLKLLLVAFLAAYLADKLPARLRTIHLLYPTIILSGIVILLLVVQRDLGTAAIFTALYTVIIFLATSRKRVLWIALILLLLIGLAGYFFVGIIQARVNAWLNPWDDPSGRSYQIIQSVMAIANGGILGTGPGLGSPGLIPVAISDMIYAAIAEETGLIGTLGLLSIVGIILSRGLRAALRAPDAFRRLLAAGITTYFGVQTILIVGGNIRLLPLTGVTLPFVSYGGSSLLTSFIALLVLMHISNHLDVDPAPLSKPQPYLALGAFLLLGLVACALATGWWSVIRGPDLLTRPDNRRRLIETSYVPRGALLDTSSTAINVTSGTIGDFIRDYQYVDLAPITGYTDATYGQAGLEATLDDYLRGLKGNPTSMIFWNNLLYGMDPTGLDVRLSIDLDLQSRSDEMMFSHRGAVVLLNAQSGEILVMASHPTFNPNHLAESGSKLLNDPGKPLINRATLGQYPAGTAMQPFADALTLDATSSDVHLDEVYKVFGFDTAPQIQLPVAPVASEEEATVKRVSPLQMALAVAALSNHGVLPAPRIAMAVRTPNEGWIPLPAFGSSLEAIQAQAADEAAFSYLVEDQMLWRHIGQAQENDLSFTWFIGGTPPNRQAAPLALVILLEEANSRLAERIGKEILTDAMNP